MDSGEMRRAVICNAEQDSEKKGPDAKLSLTHADRHQSLYATDHTGDWGVVQDLL